MARNPLLPYEPQAAPMLPGDADMGVGLDPVDAEFLRAYENEQRYGATLPPMLEPGALTGGNEMGAPYYDSGELMQGPASRRNVLPGMGDAYSGGADLAEYDPDPGAPFVKGESLPDAAMRLLRVGGTAAPPIAAIPNVAAGASRTALGRLSIGALGGDVLDVAGAAGKVAGNAGEASARGMQEAFGPGSPSLVPRGYQGAVGMPSAKPLARASKDIPSDPNYVYHATNLERAQDIADDKLRTFKPSDFTDQDMWPDGSVEKRAYFSAAADSVADFAPEEGQSVVLRVRRDAVPVKVERGTGDIYTTRTIGARNIEALTEDGTWVPLKDAFTQPRGQAMAVPADRDAARAARGLDDEAGAVRLPGSGGKTTLTGTPAPGSNPSTMLDNAAEAATELIGDMGGGAQGGVLGLRQAAQGLPGYERLANRLRSVAGMAQTSDVATPIMQERKRIKEVARNQAAVISAEAGARVRQAFSMDKKGLVKGLDDVNFPKGMTVQDAAARLPTVWGNMTPEQQKTMVWLRETLAPYKQLWDDVQDEAGQIIDRDAKALNSRGDVINGGFYIPRGSADIAGIDEPVKVRVSGGTGSGKGFQKAATFDSAAEGIANGYEYASVDDAIRSYVRNIGDDIANRNTANALLELTDDAGARLASSAADRVDPQLRGAVQKLASQIGQRRITALSRRIRAGAQGMEAKRAESMAARADQLATNAERRLMQRIAHGSPDTVIAAAERELMVLRREASKDLTAATGRRGVSAATATKLQSTLQELDTFQNQLTVLRGRYKRAQDLAKNTPRERGRVDMVELQAYDFPDAIANAANMALKEEQRLTNPGVLDKAAQMLQGAYRTTTATLDNSGVGIQGLLGWYTNPKATSKALAVNMKTMLDPDAFGAFVQRFNENAKAKGLPDVMEWSRHTLRTAGPGEELRAGSGFGKLTQKIRNAPGIKQADQMFAAMGDSLRLGWAQDEAETMMKKLGRPLNDEELDGIAKSVNRFTGYVSDPAGGAVSDLLLYSPRYFQSRIETTLNAVAGLRPGATLEQKLARRTMARTLVGGAMITYAANAALGQETDARPVVTDGHGGLKRNPNFMRIRFNDLDWSVFGGYDSLLGLVLTAATGRHDQALRQFMTGPAPSMMWDLWVGSTVDGKRTRDKPEQLLKYLAESFAPFSAGDMLGSLGAAGQAAMAGDPLKATAGVVASGLTALGAKQSPMSFDDIRTELVQNVVRESMSAGNPNGYTDGTTIDGLSKADMRKVYEDKRLKAKGDQFEDAPIPDAQRINQASDEYDVKRQNLDAKLGEAISKGLSGKDLKEAIQQWKRDGFTAYDTTLGNPEVTAASARLSREKRPPMRDQLAQKYWDVPLEEKDGKPDRKAQQAAREAILNEARGLGYDTDYMIKRGEGTYRGQSIKDERVREAVERYEKAQDVLRPYWDVPDKVTEKMPALKVAVDKVQKLEVLYDRTKDPRVDAALKSMRADPAYRAYNNLVEETRDRLRLKDAAMDDALSYWYGAKPIKQKLAGKQ